MNNLENAKSLYTQIGQGQVLEAFEKYYADNVVMQEPNGTREGKDVCRGYEEQFVAGIQEFHGMDIKSMAADESNGKVLIEVAMDITFKDGNRVNMEQTTVQQWENNQIVHERFYYNS